MAISRRGRLISGVLAGSLATSALIAGGTAAHANEPTDPRPVECVTTQGIKLGDMRRAIFAGTELDGSFRVEGDYGATIYAGGRSFGIQVLKMFGSRVSTAEIDDAGSVRQTERSIQDGQYASATWIGDNLWSETVRTQGSMDVVSRERYRGEDVGIARVETASNQLYIPRTSLPFGPAARKAAKVSVSECRDQATMQVVSRTFAYRTDGQLTFDGLRVTGTYEVKADFDGAGRLTIFTQNAQAGSETANAAVAVFHGGVAEITAPEWADSFPVTERRKESGLPNLTPGPANS